MTGLATLQRTHARLAAGEPIRILIGHSLHNAAEIEPCTALRAGLRAAFLADLERQIAALTAASSEGEF